MIKIPKEEQPMKKPEFPPPEDEIIKRGEIIRLSNSHHYFLHSVSAMKVKNGCKLIVFKKGKIILAKTYMNFHGAKVAFSRLFFKYAFNIRVRQEWSFSYEPETLPL
jgi:hypothetical protein